ncbi:MAG: type II CAAX endopeptidase family protein [Candidatus Saccharimonas sp.]
MKKLQAKRILYLVGLPLWVILSFVMATLLCSLVVGNASLTTTESLLFQAVSYSVTLLILLGLPYVLKGYKVSLKTMGLERLMSWFDILLAIAGFIVYFLLAMTLLALAHSLFSSFDATQAQDLGVSSQLFGAERMQAFFLMVVIGPIVEEVIFRGYLYGELRKQKMPAWLTTLVVSVLFGIAHGQWNVGIDVFALSVSMCVLRELTGSIWAGVLVHIIKNLIAFIGVFVLMS